MCCHGEMMVNPLLCINNFSNYSSLTQLLILHIYVICTVLCGSQISEANAISPAAVLMLVL